jgi:hypothetical protein
MITINLPDCQITGKKLKAKHHQFIIDEDLEMYQLVKISYYHDDTTTMKDWILAQNFTPTIRDRHLKMFEDRIIKRTTKGVWVNAQGQKQELVNLGTEEEPNWQYPVDSITELVYWQGVSVAEGVPPISVQVYVMLEVSMQNMIQNQVI